MNSGWSGLGQKEHCESIPGEEKEDEESEDNPLRGQVGADVPRRKLSSAALRLQRTLLSQYQKRREATMPPNSCRGLSRVGCKSLAKKKQEPKVAESSFLVLPSLLSDFN